MRTRILLAAASLLVVTATPAAAHTDVVSTLPKAGAILVAPTESISITFSEPVEKFGSSIAVTDSTGTAVAVDRVAISGATMSIPWPVSLAPGTVSVSWRAVADDGHVLTDTFSFEFTPNDEPPTIAPTPLPVTSASPSDAAGAGIPWWWGLLALAGVGTGLAYRWVKR